MGDVKLTSPRVKVVREGQPDLEIQTTNADMVLWDLTRPKQRPVWPNFQEAPFLWLTFLSWAAARRTGAIETGYTFDRWRDDVLDVTTADEDEETEAGAPFPQEPGPDLFASVAIVTGTSPSAWWEETDETLATCLDLLQEQAARAKKASRKH